MPLEVLVERWFAVGWIVFGLSHLLYPAKWAALFLPLRERDTGAFLVATFNLPLGLGVVLAHNVWVWDLPVIVTLAGWMMVVKSLFYLLIPRALRAAMPDGKQLERSFVIAGALFVGLGALLVYHSFCRR